MENVTPDPENKDLSQGSPENQKDFTQTPAPEQIEKPKNKRYIVIGFLSLLALLVASAAAYAYFASNDDSQKSGANSSQKIIKIGLLTTLSGSSVAPGTAIKQGVELAIKEFNKEGLTVQLVTKDTTCSADKSGPATKELIEKDKVVAIIGDLCSGATLEAAKHAEQYKVPLVSPASTSPKISDAGEYVFRTVPSDALQGKFIVEKMRSKNLSRLAIMYGNEPYGIGLNDSLKENFEKSGGTVTASSSFENETIDFTAQFQKIKATKPDVIYLISNSPTSMVAMVLGTKEAAIPAAVYTSESFKSDASLKDAGTAAEGVTLAAVSDGTASFQEKYEAVYGMKVDAYTAQGYDAFIALSLALAGGATTGEEIKDALYKLDFEGASGPIKFDTKGDIAGNYLLYTVRDKKFVLTQ